MINLYDIHLGDVVETKKGSVGICVENMGDGQWIEIEYDGETELVHSQDIVSVKIAQVGN